MTAWIRGTVIGVGAAFAYLAASVGAARLCTVNTSPSLPIGLYRVVSETRPRIGDLVLVCLPTPIADFARSRGYLARGRCHSGVQPLGKGIAGVPGDTIVLATNGVVVNGRPIARTIPLRVDSRGRPLPQLVGDRWVLRPGEFWLLATGHLRSFDSRYFGPTSADAVIAIVRPVWTW